MRIGILGTATSWHVQDLIRSAEYSGHSVEVVPFTALIARVGNLRIAEDLRRFDAVIVRSMPKGTLEQIIFRMDVLGEFARQGGLVVNPPGALEICIDKYLALSRLQFAGLVVPDTIVCQSTTEALDAFTALGEDVVLKPLFGSEGKGLKRVSNVPSAKQHIEGFVAGEGVVYVQQFVQHVGYDYRVFVVGDHFLGMRRSNPGHWKFNVRQGAMAERFDVNDAIEQLARSATKAVGATVAGVDLLPDRHGRLVVLEVNAVPGWRALGQATGADVAGLVVEHLEQRVAKRAETVADRSAI
jgi:RimK family alpha-L-glutamate ligase